MTGPPPPPPSSTSVAASAPVAVEVPPNRRQSVVDLLQARFADDSLSLEEYERRVAAAYQVRTVSDLDALVADLTNQVSRGVPDHDRIVTILSNNERSNSTPVARRLEILCVMGNVELDLSSSIFGPGLTEIDISSTLGNVDITVPLGIRVESSGGAIVGTFDCKVPNVVERYHADESVIRISGRSLLSSVQIGAAPSRYPAASLQSGDAPRRLT
ncbi:MAG: DUF1707 domain-containing protein [Gemmatimonadaceae bacterium]